MGRSHTRDSAERMESTAVALHAALPLRGSGRHSRATVADEDHQSRADNQKPRGRSVGEKPRGSSGRGERRGNVPSRERRGMQPLPMDLEDPGFEGHADRRRGQRRRRRHGDSNRPPGQHKGLPFTWQCAQPAVVSGAFVLLLLASVFYFTPGSLSSRAGELTLAAALALLPLPLARPPAPALL